jgi:general secretion pathway protein D
MSMSERLRQAPGHSTVTPPPRRVGFKTICIAASAAALAAASQPAAAQQAAQEGPAARTSSIGHSPALKSKTPVTLNFVNAEVDAVSRAMGAMLERQIVVDPRVKGTITLFSEQPLSVREAYLNYLAALRGLGFTVVEVAGLLKVVPEADAKLQTGTVTIGNVSSQRGDQILTQVFRLNHENVNSLVPVLRPLISPNNTINANPGNNSLVITDYADNLRRIGRIIAALDVPSSGDVEVIALEHAVAADLAPLVQRLAEGASPVPGAPAGAAAGTATTILVEPRSNALLVRAANPARLASIRALVAKLDQPAAGGAAGGGNIWVVPLRNADAVKLATVLRAAFGSGAGAGGSSTPTVATTPVATAAGAQGASPQAAAPVTPGAGPSTGGFVQADPSTNSLIITAPEPLYRQVRAMIDQLDSRRAQVYIESMIVEVQGDNAADFGFQWQGLLGNKGDKNIVGAGTNFGTTGNIIEINKAAASGGDIAIGEGLNIGLVHNFSGVYALASIARFLQSQANTNIVSTPNLITLDNEEAKIIVGSNVPFVTGQYTNTGTGTTSPFQTIERKDVGITLRIRPQIGEGGTVRMTIFQEASSLSSQVAPGTSNAGPSTNKRSIESTVVVDDGGILVLGGLIEDRYIDNNAKVPGLGDIPGVGGLFRSESRTRTRTNLMVFLRPVIMRDTESANRLSLDRYDLIRANQQAAQPKPSVVLPINEGPLAPPIEPAGSAPAPALAVPAPGAPASAPAN